MKTTIILHSESLGKGDEKLGKILMASFLRKLWGLQKKPDVMIFYNSAVNLLTDTSSVLDALDALSKDGVDLIGCKTCIGFYNIEQKLSIGRMVDMQEIVSLLMKSDRVITP
ncbi:MAG: DsrE family protein [Thermoplasmatota archaeon]